MPDIQRRIFLGFAAAAIPAAIFGRVKTQPVVLFVCEFGTAKSAIARELFRRRARERGIAVTAFSRGLQIEDHVSPPLRQKLDADGIETRADGFAILTPDDIRAADIVVTFARLPAGYRPRRMFDWTALPSVNGDWPAARAQLDTRIDALLDRIMAKGERRK